MREVGKVPLSNEALTIFNMSCARQERTQMKEQENGQLRTDKQFSGDGVKRVGGRSKLSDDFIEIIISYCRETIVVLSCI